MAALRSDTVFGTPDNAPVESETDDSISISSTVVSEENPDETYIVENILAERYFPEEDQVRYLVKWEGYPVERCSWEPIEMFDDFGTVSEWKEIQKKQMDATAEEEVFDWRQWDEDRQAERLEQEIRKERREKKRAKMARHARQGRNLRAPIKRGNRKSTSKKIAGFIDDDEEVVSVLEESDSDDPIAWKRKRFKAQVSGESAESDEDESDDSLMEDLKMKEAKRSKGSIKPVTKPHQRRSGEGNERSEQAEIPRRKAPKGRNTISNNSHSRVVEPDKPVLRTLGPQSGRDAGTQLDQPGPSKPASKSKPGPKPGASKLGPSKPGPKPGPSKRRQVSGSGPAGAPQYRNLSTMNRLTKMSRNERAPDMGALKLFPAGNPARGSSIGSPTLQTLGPTGVHGKTASKEVLRSPERDKSPNEQDPPRVQKRKGFEERPGGSPHNGPQPYGWAGGQGPQQKRRLSEDPRKSGQTREGNFIMSPRREEPRPALATENPGSYNNIGHQAGRPEARFNTNKKGFECELVIQTPEFVMDFGPAKFVGFSSSTLEMLENSGMRQLSISKFLEDTYIAIELVPALGISTELADVFIDGGKCQPLISALASRHGAGVVMCDACKIVLFQPTNEKISGAFKTPLQQVKTPLRAVLYNNWDTPPSQEFTMMEPASGMPQRAQYIHTLLYKMLGPKCHEILGFARENPEGLRNFVTYYPERSKLEGLEMEQALKALGMKLWNFNEIPRVIQEHAGRHQKFKVTVLVHITLRRQLHLLPHIKLLKLRDQPFYFFGTRFVKHEGAYRLETHPMRFWAFGTLILLTPKFAIHNPGVLEAVLSYQRAKAGSTKIAIVSSMLAQVEEYLITNPRIPDRANNQLMAVYQLEDKVGSSVVKLWLDTNHENNELETIADAFALYLIEKCSEYRRFILAHSKEEEIPELKELYNCIDFHTPESLTAELEKGTKKPSDSSRAVIAPDK